MLWPVANAFKSSERVRAVATNYYIGWDVGAWHCSATGTASKDALAILDEDLTLIGIWEGNLKNHILSASQAPNPGANFVEAIFSCCKCLDRLGDLSKSNYLFAIDTPLGWPQELYELLSWLNNPDKPTGVKASVSSFKSKIKNPLLHRKTETLLGKAMSTVQDQIGSQSTKALFCLRAIGAKIADVGVWKESSANATLIETYPAPCIRSLDFLDVVKRVKLTDNVNSVDKFDALVCGVLGFVFDRPQTAISLSTPGEDIEAAEGWVFTPENLLPLPQAISYGRLIESRLPSTPLSEIVSHIQLGMVLKGAIAASKENKTDWSEMVSLWATRQSSQDKAFQHQEGTKLRDLFLLLNPKVKKNAIPSDTQFEEIAQRITTLFAFSDYA